MIRLGRPFMLLACLYICANASAQPAAEPRVTGYRLPSVRVLARQPDGTFKSTLETVDGARVPPQSLRILGDSNDIFVHATDGSKDYWFRRGNLRYSVGDARQSTCEHLTTVVTPTRESQGVGEGCLPEGK